MRLGISTSRVPAYNGKKRNEFGVMSRLLILFAMALGLSGANLRAQDLVALARVLPEESTLSDQGGTVELRLSLTQPVPYRVFSLDNPRRLVIDFNEVDWIGFDAEAFDKSAQVDGLRFGVFRPGWSRMVLDLVVPLSVRSAELTTSAAGPAQVILRLEPTSDELFAANAGAPEGAFVAPRAEAVEALAPLRRQIGDRPVVVVLDPGHGGIDPGAERGDAVEADLMLIFALELKETLLRTGNFKVVLTRDSDVFVPLETRVSLARQAQADVFLSLHADAIVEGRASGATIYTLSEKASDVASQKLAERHDRSDLLAGVDLSNQDDVIAAVLMDMARTETAPRSDKLADALVVGLSNTVSVHKRPRLSAGFSVLKAPDIPSVLLELGFLSSKRDRQRLEDAQWRVDAAAGIRDALLFWAAEDAADALLLRK